MVLPCHLPEVAIWTGPGVPSEGLQQPILVVADVLGIAGFAHQVAARSGTPPNLAETNCHGGTLRADGLEISLTPLDRVTSTRSVLFDLWPSSASFWRRMSGPP